MNTCGCGNWLTLPDTVDNSVIKVSCFTGDKRDLKAGDLRRELLEYMENPKAFANKMNLVEQQAESPFEAAVAKALIIAGYHISQQWTVGSYHIDMVVQYKRKKIAIECDGEQYHSSVENIRADMERLAILERLGWRFIRIRGSPPFWSVLFCVRSIRGMLGKLDLTLWRNGRRECNSSIINNVFKP